MVEQASPLPVSVASAGNSQLPAPMAKYEEVVADSQLFMTSLKMLHSVMGTKFKIPVIGGRELDLHKLFVEVTSRGGIEEVVREKRWKEVASTFNFPPTATNASFFLRKYYCSLLQPYERIYYHKTPGSVPPSTGAPKSTNAAPSAVTPAPALTVGTSVIGVIDGKFESGYLVTVRMGNDTLKGALYQSTPTPQSFR
ncbi:hypothetical protein RND81_14G051200 [Saponaria officinalis]|uniref:ARID domain-containing protein n=1 Tax=Saponaria officinalis TaxID=3572 RepID=A0AAW1GLK1_SAPOF